MKPVHRRDIIRGVRKQFNEQYAAYPGTHRFRADGLTVAGVRDTLARLDLETCSAADIDAAIGVTGWANNLCDECGGDFEIVFRFGNEPDYDARWWDVCENCLRRAAEQRDSARGGEREDG